MHRHTLVILALAALVGCRPAVQLGQVQGTVRSGGQPLAGVLVTFLPETSGPTARVRSLAVTDEQGRFRLQTEQQQEGAVVGSHRVIVEDLAIANAPRSPDGTVLQHPPERFGPRYSDPLRSPLACQVKSGSQSIDFDLN